MYAWTRSQQLKPLFIYGIGFRSDWWKWLNRFTINTLTVFFFFHLLLKLACTRVILLFHFLPRSHRVILVSLHVFVSTSCTPLPLFFCVLFFAEAERRSREEMGCVITGASQGSIHLSASIDRSHRGRTHTHNENKHTAQVETHMCRVKLSYHWATTFNRSQQPRELLCEGECRHSGASTC